MPKFFDREMADRYDERNRPLRPIVGALHFLTRLALADLPARARILCVGVGTGAEILSLAEARPDWTFVGADPSVEMLDVCRGRLLEAGVADRCDLIHGYIDDAPSAVGYDAVLSILVAHFIRREGRAAFYRAVHDRLKPGGAFVSAEICADLDAPEFPAMLKDWKQVQTLMGVAPDALEKLEDGLRRGLGVLSPAETEAFWRAAGFDLPIPFFQAFMVRGWHGTKA